MVNKLRARSTEDKLARRESILKEALAMWDQVAYANFTMNALAQRLGLAKGTLYLYFPTKEELFLTLYEGLLGDWFAALEAELARPGAWNPERVADAMGETLGERPALLRLIPLLEGILEQNITPEKARAYKQWLLQRVLSAGAKLEAVLPYLNTGDGVRVLVYAQALVSGLQQMGAPSPVMAQVLQDTSLALLKVEFYPTLRSGLAALLRGLKPRVSRSAEIG